MRYRPHRRFVDEAVALTVEVEGRAGLIEQLHKEFAGLPVWPDEKSVHVDPYGGNDDRIGWKNVHIVTLDGYGVVGFCEGPAT
jgi:hypothetical protein